MFSTSTPLSRIQMSASNRANLIGKLHAALKKHYKVPPAQPARPLLEHALYASLLEDCPADLADEALAKCEQEFFDWNEVRVTTVTELSQVFSRLPDAAKAAQRLKGNLQSIFEEFYTFDLDHLKKENLGKAVAKFEKMPGMTPFVLSYTVQHGLGGHAIPIDYSAMVVMLVLGIASQTEASSGRVPGLERAIPKSKGVEFASLLHQAAVAIHIDHQDKTGRTVLDAVVKGSSSQLDDWLKSKEAAKKRVARRRADEKAAKQLSPEVEIPSEPSKSKSEKKAAPKKAASDKLKSVDGSKPESSKTESSKTSSGKTAGGAKSPSTPKKAPAKNPAAKKSAGSKKGNEIVQPAAPSSKGSKESDTASAGPQPTVAKKASNRKLTKRKPR